MVDSTPVLDYDGHECAPLALAAVLGDPADTLGDPADAASLLIAASVAAARCVADTESQSMQRVTVLH